MSVFNHYASYYDLLYQDKDYGAEAQFIHHLIQTHAPTAKTILDLGCGTGVHAALLAEKGYQVHGVDLSQEMLQRAIDRLSQRSPQLASQLAFSLGDIREFRLNQTFDVVTSLFHVISYQIENQDIQAVFSTAKAHLKPEGIFVFDFWYGPAVLSESPTTRIKRLENSEIKVVRIAEPTVHPNQNIVDVDYQVFIQDKQYESIEEFTEKHRMRYMFLPEIKMLLSEWKFEIINCGEWLTNADPALNTWGVYLVTKLT
jgi:SAM-dependent methyltransferase